jgi:hypothetical protein
MRRFLRTLYYPAVLVLMANGAAAYGLDREVRQTEQCQNIDGTMYCECDSSVEPCAPPNCILINDVWYCPA